MGGNVRTARVVAEIFHEFFFLAVWIEKACLNRDPRHGEFCQILYIIF
jgi:hypothetical protein